MKYKVWLDSGANAFSEYTQIVDTDLHLGISDVDWLRMDEFERDEILKDVAWSPMDWGYSEVENED